MPQVFKKIGPYGLTPREDNVIQLIGKPNKIIALKLGIGEGTVKIYIGRIKEKLRERNRTKIAVLAAAAGYIRAEASGEDLARQAARLLDAAHALIGERAAKVFNTEYERLKPALGKAA